MDQVSVKLAVLDKLPSVSSHLPPRHPYSTPDLGTGEGKTERTGDGRRKDRTHLREGPD